MKTPILYSFRRCPYAMRARMAVFVSGQTTERREVVLRDKPAEMLALSAKGTVPVLSLPSGEVIDESIDIMLWALRFADPLQWLQPDLGSTQGMLVLIRECDEKFKPHLDRYKYANRYEGESGIAHRDKAAEFLLKLDQRLQATPYLYGHKAALADYAIMPFIRQFAATDRVWFAATPYQHLQHWLEGLLGDSPFNEVMTKYTKWQTGHDVTLFGKG